MIKTWRWSTHGRFITGLCSVVRAKRYSLRCAYITSITTRCAETDTWLTNWHYNKSPSLKYLQHNGKSVNQAEIITIASALKDHRQLSTLHCWKPIQISIGKWKIQPLCKIVTPENFILKLGAHDYVEDVTYYTISDVDLFSGGFSPNRWNMTVCNFFRVLYCPFSRSDAKLKPRGQYSRFMAQMAWLSPKIVRFWVRMMSDIIWWKCAPKIYKKYFNKVTSLQAVQNSLTFSLTLCSILMHVALLMSHTLLSALSIHYKHHIQVIQGSYQQSTKQWYGPKCEVSNKAVFSDKTFV